MFKGEFLNRYIATITTKGQVTIPADVRRKPGVGATDKVVFVVTDAGTVELRPVRYTLDEVLGSIEALPGESVDLDREIAEATEAEIARKARRSTRR